MTTGCPARSVHHVCSIHAKTIHPIFISFSDIVPWNMQIVCIESFLNTMIPSVFFSPLKIWSVSPIFGDKVISNKTANIWSPHSPDLNPPDFFLWGFLKDNVYVNRPQTIAALKEEITRVIDAITRATCQRVIENFKKRIDTCIVRDGGHLEHILKHKGW